MSGLPASNKVSNGNDPNRSAQLQQQQNTFKPQHRPANSMDLARQYSQDMANINRSVFRSASQRYLSHVRIIEDSKSPSSRPPPNSPQSNKKSRFLILSIKESGKMDLHKAKESSNGTIQIGRSWNIEELKSIELDIENPNGFICTMAKSYYWETNSPKERRVWLTSLLEKYIKHTNGGLPELINCDAAYFHLDKLFKQMNNKGNETTNSSVNRSSINETMPPDTKEMGSARAAAAVALIGGKVNTGNAAATQDRKVEDLERQRALDERNLIERQKEEQLRQQKEAELKRQQEAEAAEEALAREKAKAMTLLAMKKKQEEAKQRSQEAQQREEKERKIEQQHQEKAELLRLAQFEKEKEEMSFSFDNNDDSAINNVLNTHPNPHDNDNVEIDDIMADYSETIDDRQTAPLQLNLKNSNSLPSTNYNIPQIKVNGNISTIDEEIEEPPLANSSILLNNTLESINQDIPTLSAEPKEHRSRALSRAHDDTLQNDDFMDLLEEVGYDPNIDDADSLEGKVLKQLEKLQYIKIKALAESTSVVASLEKSLNASVNSCISIDPTLAAFNFQLSTFKEDVEYIETQGQGLQVLATNKKILRNELFDMVHSVEISDSKLELLLNNPITLGFQNQSLENVLVELYSALLRIKGNKDDEDTQLSNMAALQETKEKFESANLKFILNLKLHCKKLFAQTATSLNSKLSQCNGDTFENDFTKSIMKDRFSYLLTLNGLIAYVKSVSETDYKEIITSFVDSFSQFFNNLNTFMIQNLHNKLTSINTCSFSFQSLPKNIFTDSYHSLKNKKGNGILNNSKNILEELGLNVQKNENNFANKVSGDSEIKIAHFIKNFCSQLMFIVSMEQSFMSNLFSISSSNSSKFLNVVKEPIEIRCENFTKKSSFFTSNKETDRDISDSIFSIMGNLFDHTFTSSVKELGDLTKRDILQTPAIMYILQDLHNSIASTNNEYLFHSFAKLVDRITAVWEREISIEIQKIHSTKVNYKVMNYTKAYSVFFQEVQYIIDSLNLSSKPIFGLDEKVNGNYKIMWQTISSALHKGLTGSISNNSSTTSIVNETQDVNELNGKIQNHLTFLVNYKWLAEESRLLEHLPKDIYKEINESRTSEMKFFIDSLTKRHDIGKLSNLIDELEVVVNTNTNPSVTTKYSASNLEKILMLFREEEFQRTIRELSEDLSRNINGSCAEQDKENEQSFKIAQNIEKELYNNCMNSVSQLYITKMNQLNTILSKYYPTVSLPYDKSNVTYYFKKTYR